MLQLTTYDFVLVSIPTISSLVWLASRALGYSHTTAVTIACLTVFPIVLHALFIDPPAGRRPGPDLERDTALQCSNK